VYHLSHGGQISRMDAREGMKSAGKQASQDNH